VQVCRTQSSSLLDVLLIIPQEYASVVELLLNFAGKSMLAAPQRDLRRSGLCLLSCGQSVATNTTDSCGV
jgi:uncharacterized protein YjeT (DUF2065 family)